MQKNRDSRAPTRLIFLPGASGNTQFWVPVANRLTYSAEKVHVGWPGFGPTPPDPRVNSFDDLVGIVTAKIDGPTALIAQSMGGVIAMRAALEKPTLVTHLVLTVTSGGVNMSDLGAQDWRPAFEAANPTFPKWFSGHQENLGEKLRTLSIPTILLWGDADPISPVAVGKRLASILPKATLHVFPNGTHDLGNTFAETIAPIVDEHLSRVA